MAALLMGALASVPLAHQRGPAVSPEVLTAQQVLTAAYPELREARLTWRVTTDDEGATLEAVPVVAPFEAPSTSPQVSALVRLDEDGRLAGLTVGGTLVQTVRQQVAPITARTPSAIADALRAAGAKFIPGEPNSTDGLVPVGMTQALGTTAQQATFRSEKSAETADDALTWAVEVQTGDAMPRRYELVFEPVEGRLLAVVRR